MRRVSITEARREWSKLLAAVEAGEVMVDGKVESRKRAKLRPGQRVQFGGEEIVLVAGEDVS